MKKIIKILSVPIFSTIRKIIKFAIVAKEVFKKNCLPEELINKTPPLNPYQDFYAYYQYIEDKKKAHIIISENILMMQFFLILKIQRFMQ